MKHLYCVEQLTQDGEPRARPVFWKDWWEDEIVYAMPYVKAKRRADEAFAQGFIVRILPVECRVIRPEGEK